MPVAVVKLGSSIVAEDNGELRLSVVARITEEVAALHRSGVDVVVVTSGAIARGVQMLSLPLRPTAIEELQAASAVGQGRLYRIYDELLRERGIQSAQVLLTFFDMSARTHYLNARRTLSKLLEWRIVPVINENDTTTTDDISFGDNDFLAAQVSVLVAADVLVLLTDTEGLYTADPRTAPDAELVRDVTDPEELEALQIGHAASPLGSGGMRSKVVAAEMASAAGIPTVIGSGLLEGVLARALREGAASLLPVGIVDVQGGFDAGDAVDVRDGRSAIGKGICNYSADELRQIMGLKSAQVREILPRATDEAVHRDYFV